MIATLKELNIIIAGVGGQGVVLLSEILGNAAVYSGLKLRGSEVLGMAQRGGSVFSNIRLGENVEAPMNMEGKCDILLVLEPSEALRNIQYINKDSIVIINMRKVIPSTVSLGISSYPDLDQLLEIMKENSGKLITLDAIEIAEAAGNHLSANMVMLGALLGCDLIPVDMEIFKALLREHFPAKIVDVNIQALSMGYQMTHSMI